jgi:hypothetical protein
MDERWARLAENQQRLCRARNIVARQGAILRHLQRHRHPTSLATALLATFEASLAAIGSSRATLKLVLREQEPRTTP